MKQLEQFAEHLANSKSIADASRLMRLSVEQGQALYRQICRELGPQAR